MNKVRFAVIGVGGFGRAHCEAICSTPEAELVAVCDVRVEVAMQRADMFGCTYYTDYRELLSDGGFDCVTIAVQDQVHAEIAVNALSAGYHVVCEKPLAMTLEECEQILGAVKSSGKLFMTGHSQRKNNVFRAVKKLIDDGEIGRVYHFETEYSHNYEHLKPVWRRDPVRLRYPMVGGGCHAVDIVRWIMGEPEEVIAVSNHIALPSWPVDDCTIALLKMKNGAVGKITCSIGIKKKYSMNTTFCGTEGTIDCSPREDTIVCHKEILHSEGYPTYEEHEIEFDDIGGHNVAAEIKEMCRAILYGEPIDCTAIEGANSVAVALAIVESAKLGGKAVKPRLFKE